MFAELLCGAVALVLYVNTLGADFCYDDRYLLGWMNEVQPPRVTNTAVPTVCLWSALHHSMASPTCSLIRSFIHLSWCRNSEWAVCQCTGSTWHWEPVVNKNQSAPEGDYQITRRIDIMMQCSSWCSFTSSACQKLSNHYIPVSCRHLLSGEFTRLWSHTVSTYSSHVPCSRRGHFCFLFYRMSSEIRIVLGAKCSRVWTFPKSLSCTGGNNWSLEEKLCLPAPQDESRTVLNVQPDESVWLWIRFSKKKMNGRVVTLRLKPSVWGMELSARVQRGNALLIAGLLIFDGWMVVRASGSLMQPPCLDVGQRHRYFPPAIIS